jgi:hypothetical protein
LIRSLILAAALLIAAPAAADPACGTRAALVEQIQTLDHVVAFKLLTAQEATAAVNAVSELPPGVEITDGLGVMLADGTMVVATWHMGGECGHIRVPPHLVEQALKAIAGVGA